MKIINKKTNVTTDIGVASTEELIELKESLKNDIFEFEINIEESIYMIHMIDEELEQMKNINIKLHLFFENKGDEELFEHRYMSTSGNYIVTKRLNNKNYFTFIDKVDCKTHTEKVMVMQYSFEENMSPSDLKRKWSVMDDFSREHGFAPSLKKIRREMNKLYNTFRNKEEEIKNDK